MEKLEKEHNKTKEERNLLKPKNDVVFQSLFSKKNEYITKEFVGALLDKEIEKILINDIKELFREYPEDNLGILDLEVDVDDKEKVDIEIQLVQKEDFIERLLFYFSKLYTLQIKKGKSYKESKRIVLIAIIDFKLEITKDIEKMLTKWKLRCDEKTEKILTDKIELDIIELGKVDKEYKRDIRNKKAQWMMFLNNPESKEVCKIMEENKGVKEAVVTIRKMSKDEKIRKLAELREKAIMDEKSCYNTGLHEGEKRGKELGIKLGEKQGKEKEKIEIAKALLESGMNKKEVIKITKLDEKKMNEAAKYLEGDIKL